MKSEWVKIETPNVEQQWAPSGDDLRELVRVPRQGLNKRLNPTEQTAQQYIAKLESRIKELEDTAISMEAIVESKNKELARLRASIKVFY